MTKTITYDETKYKLVPIEPTIEMQEWGSLRSDYDLSQLRCKYVWQSMLNAAPAAEEAPGQEPSKQFHDWAVAEHLKQQPATHWEPQLKRIHPLDIPLEVFLADLPTRPCRIIKAEMAYFTHSGDEYIKPPFTVRHLLMFSRKEIRDWPNMGKKSLNEIEEWLRNIGLQLWEQHDERSLRLLRDHPMYYAAPAAEEAPQQPATHGEPVAWMWKDGTLTSDPDRADGTWTALYTSPQPTPDHIKAMQQALEWIKFYLGEPNILSPFVGARQCADDLHAALQSALKGTT